MAGLVQDEPNMQHSIEAKTCLHLLSLFCTWNRAAFERRSDRVGPPKRRGDHAQEKHRIAPGNGALVGARCARCQEFGHGPVPAAQKGWKRHI